MSNVVIQGNASGSGSVTIESPNTNSNYTLTLPNSSGTVVVTGGAQTVEFAAGTAGAPSITTTGDTNTGIYFPAADTIGFAEGGAQVGEFDSSANFKFNSGYGSVATAYGCRAWVNFNGTGTVAIREDGNVSSITDNGTGNYTVNFTNAMPDANYAVAGTCSKTTAETRGRVLSPVEDGTYSTTAVQIQTRQDTIAVDNAIVSVAIFR